MTLTMNNNNNNNSNNDNNNNSNNNNNNNNNSMEHFDPGNPFTFRKFSRDQKPMFIKTIPLNYSR